MSEIKERARAEAARILGTRPGCTTCVEAADTIARLTRERDEARKYANHFGRISEAQAKSLSHIVDVVQRYQPEGSPPSGDETVLTAWVLEQMHARATAAEAMVCEQEDTIARLTRERDEARERIVALEAQLTTRGACECGADDVCALARRAQEAERKRDEARRQVAALTEGLRLVSDALARLDHIYRADTDLGDPPVETPMWLREAQHRAAALLTPTAPAAGAGLCSARVNSAGNLCLMPAGHAGDHYPPTERAPQVIVRTDGTGPNPTPPQEEP